MNPDTHPAGTPTEGDRVAAPTLNVAAVLAAQQDQIDDLTATVAAQQRVLDELLADRAGCS